MDQTQWKALNQMLTKQTASNPSVSGAQTQYKTILTGNQQQAQYILLPGGTSLTSGQTLATSTSGRTSSGQRTSRQSLNGTTRAQQSSGSGETEIVKSLLTGRQYGKSILRPDVGRGNRQARSSASGGSGQVTGKTAGSEQVSLLQTGWQQATESSSSSLAGLQIDPNIQQLICSSDVLPENLAAGEVMYVMVGDQMYKLVGGQAKQGSDASAVPVTTGISLHDLATISAQQESIKSEIGFAMQSGDDSSGTATVVLQEALQASLESGQFIQQTPDGAIATTEDGTQLVVMSGDGFGDMQAATTAAAGRVGEGVSTIKLGGQDFVLQDGQQLPAEIQERVAKGLPIDWSNYEFVIEGENGPETTEGFMMAPAGVLSAEDLGLAEMSQQLVLAGAGGDMGTAAAETEDAFSISQQPADLVKGESMSEELEALASAPKTVTVQVIAASPGEYDDGEFAYLASGTSEDDVGQQTAGEAAGDEPPRIVPYSGFLNSFLDFIHGKNTETLSSFVNNSTTNKPALPKYVPDMKGSSAREADIRQKYKGTPMTVIYTGDINDTSGRSVSYVMSGGTKDSTEKGKSGAAGKRKRNQLDGEGEDALGGNAEKLYKLSDEDLESDRTTVGRKAGQEDGFPPTRGRGVRGMRGRGSGIGRPGISDTTRVGLVSLLEPVMDSPVVHVTQSEPHFYQKGDFVIDRKDAYKLDSYPIWRIENGKLLQKFDPSLEDGILIHKSASVYSSWSGDIKSNFKPIMVEVLSMTATTVGRKQDVKVRVLDKYQAKAADESLEQNPLLLLFNLYVHALLNHSLVPSYLETLQQQNGAEYYLTPVIQIDQLLVEAEQAVLSEITWTENFKAALDCWSCYTVVGLRSDQITVCQATPGANKGVMTVKFYGQTYDRNLLTVTSETTLSSAQEFAIGKAAYESLGIYHSLHHFKFLLFTKCQEEVNYLNQGGTKTPEEIVDECIQNRIWVQQLFLDLKGLLERYIIIKTEDEVGDTSETQ